MTENTTPRATVPMSDMGNIVKRFEATETERRLMPGLPVVARLDGRSFSSFTKSLKKPFDLDFVEVMDRVVTDLVGEFGASCGYTQSDEITLVWPALDPLSDKEAPFGGRIQKMVGLLAARASARFTMEGLSLFPGAISSKLPSFDCRVWQFPSEDLAAACVAWREADAVKNSVSMLARAHFPEKQLVGISSRERKEALLSKDVDWNGLPVRLRRGGYCLRFREERVFTSDELEKIPVAKRPSGPVMRNVLRVVDMPPAGNVEGYADILFGRTPAPAPAAQSARRPPGP